jgi:hypothetical protein
MSSSFVVILHFKKKVGLMVWFAYKLEEKSKGFFVFLFLWLIGLKVLELYEK